ncbi:hypothetical protein LMB98_00975 [Limosilactobacillus reuteri]|uniref:HNH endonuclease n=1 Tax=Limosilactobacillus reuteri TaxID=1598 RepID=UPI001E2D725A|nr:hypothetical protein [Limosilactobacillus reuteri]MCC4396612.1 hypothetical protein [Limosilactobacillus reuteri]
MLERLDKDKVLKVDAVWENAKSRYSERKTKNKVILDSEEKKNFYNDLEQKYEKIYVSKEYNLATHTDGKFENTIFRKERDYIVSKIMEEHERCVICGNKMRDVECDHILCKKKFPALAFIPLNLVTICHFCNKSKGENITLGIFNPYFDNYDNVKFKIRFEFDFKNKNYIKVIFPDELKPVANLYNLSQTITINVKEKLDDITEEILAMDEAKRKNYKKSEILSALESRKDKDRASMHYKAEAQNNQLINDLIKYVDDYIKYYLRREVSSPY